MNNFHTYKCANCGGKLAMLKKYSLCSKCYSDTLAKKSRENGHVITPNPKVCACIGCKNKPKTNRHKFCKEHSRDAKNSLRRKSAERGNLYET